MVGNLATDSLVLYTAQCFSAREALFPFPRLGKEILEKCSEWPGLDEPTVDGLLLKDLARAAWLVLPRRNMITLSIKRNVSESK